MNKLRFLLMLFLSIFMFFGCKKWTEPEFFIPEWVGPTEPIRYFTINNANPMFSILEQHTIGNPPVPIVSSTFQGQTRYLRVVVVSSDEGGNYYKSLVLQDSTGGIEMQLDMAGLHTVYPVGQKVVIVLNGLVVGDYNHLPQMGWIYQETQVGRINSLYFDQYIIRDGMPSAKNIPRALTNNEIDFGGRDVNKLVCLERVTFESDAVGEPLAYNHITKDWTVYVPLSSGKSQEVVVRTSNFARFRSMIIEDKEYNLTGILTTYRGTPQLMIRTRNDIEMLTSESITFDFTSNPIGEGKWSIQTLVGEDRWGFRSNYMVHRGSTSGVLADDWLISPVITVPDEWENGFLHFEHQLPVLNAQYDTYQIYYTTSIAATFNINDWKELKLSSFPESFEWSNRFFLSEIGAPSFRIAFRYHSVNPGVATYEWRIKTVEIRK